MKSRLLFQFLQLRKRLWAKPLLFCLFAVAGAFVANTADLYPNFANMVPEIEPETIEKLLTIISSSMLVVATFAAGSMINAYASASSSATPRAFALVMADDLSQTALSSFIGAFIFSIVAIIALKTGLYGKGGLFVLFALTLLIFAWVILTFVRWVDNIARLGQLTTAIDKTEDAARRALLARRKSPFLGGVQLTDRTRQEGAGVFVEDPGYVQYVDMQRLQALAEDQGMRLMLGALPGAFATPDDPLIVTDTTGPLDDDLRDDLRGAFVIGKNRTFEEDPRFGLIVLSEIAARALSPGVNDPGTAIVIIGRFVRLLCDWAREHGEDESTRKTYDRIAVPELSLGSMFDDAFTAVSRDGAGNVEVGIRLQKAFATLSGLHYPGMRKQAQRHSILALAQAKNSVTLPEHLDRLRKLAKKVA